MSNRTTEKSKLSAKKKAVIRKPSKKTSRSIKLRNPNDDRNYGEKPKKK